MLVTRTADSIAAVVPESEDWVFADPFFSGTLAGVTRALADTSLQVVLVMGRPGDGHRRMERYLCGGYTDGAIVVSHHREDTLWRVLADRGCRLIATITGPQDMSAGRDRLQGWRDNLVATGLDPGRARLRVALLLLVAGAPARRGGVLAVASWGYPRPTTPGGTMGLISGLLNRASSTARRSPRGGTAGGGVPRTGTGARGGAGAGSLLRRLTGGRRRL